MDNTEDKNKSAKEMIEKLSKAKSLPNRDKFITDVMKSTSGIASRALYGRKAAKAYDKAEKRIEKEKKSQFTKGARVLSFFGHEKAAMWYERFAGKKTSEQAEKERRGEKEKEKVANKDSGARIIKDATAQIKMLNSKVDTIGQMVTDVQDDVVDIKKLLVPKGIVATGKKGTKDEGKSRFVQFNPLAPKGEEFAQVTERGKLTSIKPGKNFEQSAVKKAAFESAQLAIKMQQKEQEKAELRKKYQYTDKAESFRKSDPINLLRKDMNDNFAKVFKILEDQKSKGGLFDMLKTLFTGKLVLGAIVGAIGTTLATAFAGIKSVLSGVLGQIVKFLPGLAKMLGPVAGVVGAGLAGYAAGTALNEKYKISENIVDAIGPEPDEDVSKGTTKAEMQKNMQAKLQGTGLEWVGPGKYRDIKTGRVLGLSDLTPQQRMKITGQLEPLSKPQPAKEGSSPPRRTGAGLPSSGPSTRRTPAPSTPSASSAQQTAWQDSDTFDTNYAQGSSAPSATLSATSKGSKGSGGGKLAMPDSTIKDIITQAADRVGVDKGIMMAMAKQESSFNPNAAAKTSSAKGLYQFLDGTWADMVKKYGAVYPELSKGQLDPNASAIAGALYIKENGDILKRAGIPVDGTSIYAAHFLGPGGARTLFNADPNTDATKLMPKPAQANKGIFFNKDNTPRTVAEVQEALFNKVGKYAAMYSESLQKSEPGMGSGAPMMASNTPAPASTPPTLAATSVKPKPTISGGNLDGQARALDAGKTATVASAAPVVVNNNNVSGGGQSGPPRPVSKPAPVSEDSSFIRNASRDVHHPAYA
jgi:hypothetical protein